MDIDERTVDKEIVQHFEIMRLEELLGTHLSSEELYRAQRSMALLYGSW